MCETKLEKINEFKLRGFAIEHHEHPDTADKRYIVAVKGLHIVRLYVVPTEVADSYVNQAI